MTLRNQICDDAHSLCVEKNLIIVNYVSVLECLCLLFLSQIKFQFAIFLHLIRTFPLLCQMKLSYLIRFKSMLASG